MEGDTARFTVSAIPSGGFDASLFLEASSPTLSAARFASGRAVSTIFDGCLESGRNKLPLDLKGVAEGAYLLVLEIDGMAESGRMIMVVR